MQKKSPLQQVRDQFGSKEDLVKQLLPLVDRFDKDESDADFARRIGSASNKQLLRMWNVEQTVKSRFGSKDALVDAVVKAKFANGNADYKTAVSRLSKARLLDLHRQLKAS